MSARALLLSTKPAAASGPTIAFRSHTTKAYAVTTNTVLTAPAGLANGDILVAVILIGRGASDIDLYDPAAPAGFAGFGTPTTVNAGGFWGKLHIWWKRAASESGSYTFTHASTQSNGLLKAYSGAKASGTPLGATSNNSGTGNAASGTGITTTAANSWLLREAHDWQGTGTLSPPAGMTERYDNLLYSADQLIAAAGATGTRSQTNANSGADVWAVRMVELLAA